ncbi:hypothetical protein Xvie_03534 [Xenorhabdus vietnamensis]|uniref:DUF7424 domain-containing protein n=1 Tax=Xenorhabdus vietnamensis TaxID=351656 RepID=A0A1Y2SAR0_9GAMM|nr:hypothetical protein [Xenorhabdus vietnamensis]OTA14597.1 hypothetical protein Xvie_03534 [Xenorhabdus vietnamensis]
MKKWLAIASAALILSGCKVDIETKVNTDDLTSPEHKMVRGDIDIEVSSCNDYEDSRKESKKLIELKQKVPTIFRNAEYVECYRKKFDSYAHFTVPVDVGFHADNTKLGNADIYIASTKDVYAGVMISADTLNKVRKAQKEAMEKFDIRMSVILERGKKPVPPLINMGSFLTGAKAKDEPMLAGWMGFATKELKFRLSDVSNAALAQGEFAPILVTHEYFDFPQ